jgi:hypothetical protein
MAMPERSWLERALAKGLVLYASKWGYKLIKENFYTVEKSLKTWSEPAVTLGLGLGLSFGRQYLPEPIADSTEVITSVGVEKAVQNFIDKPPKIVALSSTEIEFLQFDPSDTLTYSIDGGATATVATDGTGYAKVTLTHALSAGKHNVSAFTKTKGVSEIVVV